MMVAAPTTKKGRRTRAKILKAARSVFARTGYVDARMLDIAKEADLSAGGLYRYFDNKTEVFAALINVIHEEFYELSGHSAHSLERNPLAALNDANRGYIEHYFRNRDVMRSFIEAAAVDDRFLKILEDMRIRHVERFTKALDRVPETREALGESTHILIEAVTFMVEQCCYIWFAQRHRTDGPKRQEVSVDQAVSNLSYIWYQAIFEPEIGGRDHEAKDATPNLSTSVPSTEATNID